jgi:hypothetical protein
MSGNSKVVKVRSEELDR